MTYREQTYQAIIDIETQIIVLEAQIKALKAEQKCLRLTNASILKKQEIDVKINVYNNYHEELKNIYEDLISYIETLVESLKDREYEIFLLKYMKGLSNKEIIDQIYIDDSVFYKYVKNIDSIISSTDRGRQFKNFIAKEKED